MVRAGCGAGGATAGGGASTEDAEADSQSVRELAAEGQTFEANVVSAIENAPPADAAEVTTHEVPEDDVPPEYLERQRDEPKE